MKTLRNWTGQYARRLGATTFCKNQIRVPPRFQRNWRLVKAPAGRECGNPSAPLSRSILSLRNPESPTNWRESAHRPCRRQTGRSWPLSHSRGPRGPGSHEHRLQAPCHFQNAPLDREDRIHCQSLGCDRSFYSAENLVKPHIQIVIELCVPRAS